MADEHHYIPRFLLDGFTDPQPPEGHSNRPWTPCLWIFEHASQTWKCRSSKNVATSADYYSFTEQAGQRHDDVEGALSRVESQTAAIYRNKIALRAPLTPDERMSVAGFLAYMVVRVPRIHAKIDEFMSELTTGLMGMYDAVPGAMDNLKERYERATGKKAPEDFSARDLEQYEIKASKAFQLGMMVEQVPGLARLFFAMTWTFIHTTAPAWLITSDSPLALRNPMISHDSFSGPGLGQRDVEVSLPLSKEVCLFATWKQGPAHYDAEPDVVEELNRVRIGASDKFIASALRGFLGVQYLQHRAP